MKTLIFSLCLLLGTSAAHAKGASQTIPMKVTDKGFEPGEIKVKPGTHVVLKITRTTDVTCATAVQFKEKNLKKDLPLNQEVTVDLGKIQKGQINFACGMDMISGHIVAQ